MGKSTINGNFQVRTVSLPEAKPSSDKGVMAGWNLPPGAKKNGPIARVSGSPHWDCSPQIECCRCRPPARSSCFTERPWPKTWVKPWENHRNSGVSHLRRIMNETESWNNAWWSQITGIQNCLTLAIPTGWTKNTFSVNGWPKNLAVTWSSIFMGHIHRHCWAKSTPFFP